MADGTPLPALLCEPEHAVATVVVAPDLFGLSPTTTAVMQRLAVDGLASIALGYHHRVGPDTPDDEEAARDRRRAMDETLAVTDLSTVVDVVRRDAPAPVPLLGLCMGGTMALVLASERSDLVAVSCYGFPRSSRMPAVSCPAPLDLVSSMRSPVLGVWGDADASVPLADVEALAAAYRTHDVDAEFLIRHGVGHSFLTKSDPGSQAAAAQTWPAITTYIRTHATDAIGPSTPTHSDGG